jgi:hypothetical protein
VIINLTLSIPNEKIKISTLVEAIIQSLTKPEAQRNNFFIKRIVMPLIKGQRFVELALNQKNSEQN